ncbi:gastrula zinc finger-like protein [Trifolium pratense]|uniref:Gastrula zinc finger-like protein n=1 Tax=Trifolium pratense TaxID=57577 RepID=A0A2K3KUU2_TRIPR|nr:gastrula zinc finger-like protein [Trifolium pratense]
MAPTTTPTATSNDNSSNKDFDDTKSGSSNIPDAGAKNVKCEVCAKTFRNESALRDHMAEKHGDKKCFKCNLNFDTDQQRQEHMDRGICSKN